MVTGKEIHTEVMKMKFLSRIGNTKLVIDTSAKKQNELTKWDWGLFTLLAIFCYVSFLQNDILLTGNRSWLFLDPNCNFFNFYELSYQWTQGDGANYLPSTFMLFALWILPLKLMGFQPPASLVESRLLFNMWYKMLPVLFYIGSAYLIYKVAMQIGMEVRKSKLCMYAFLTLPIAFYSQFIFSQYDIFTVFFMLCGMYYYYKERNTKSQGLFCLFFGIAATFKYFALLIFFVFVLLDEKNVGKILVKTGMVLSPILLEILCFWNSDAFHRGVFGFNAVGYTSQDDFSTIIGSVSFFKVAACFVVAWAYFVYPKNQKDKIAWSLFLSCGVCFAIFAFMTWHPQWLIFAAPFWVLSAFINVNLETFLWLDTAFIAVFYPFVLQVWYGGIDDVILGNGVWRSFLWGKTTYKRMADFIGVIDKNTLYSAIVVLLLVMFVFKHPKYSLQDYKMLDNKNYKPLIHLRVITAVFLFAIPAFLSLHDTIQKSNDIYLSEEYINKETTEWRAVTSESELSQTVTGIEGTVEQIGIKTATYDRANYSDLTVSIVNTESNTELVSYQISPRAVKNLQYIELDIPDFEMKKEETYKISVYSSNGTSDNCFAVGVFVPYEEKPEVFELNMALRMK